MSAPTAGLVGSEAAQLLGYLRAARWFAGKGRRMDLIGLTPLPWLSEPGSWPAVRCVVAEVGYHEDGLEETGSASELYQLALSYYPDVRPDLAAAEIGALSHPELGDVVSYDAMADPQACRVFLRRLRDADQIEGQSETTSGTNRPTVRFHLLAGDLLTDELEPRIYTGQQSNTSVMYGEVAMLKLFRRLEIGHNLDIEVHESLRHRGVGDVAQLYGWVEASWTAAGRSSTGTDALRADLAMVVEKLADAEDGWELALDTLRTGEDFRPRAQALGGALAEIHAALLQEFGASTSPGAAVSEVMATRLDRAVAVASELAPHQAGLRRWFDCLAEVALATQRVHGDFHLGQTLYTPSGWKIIDFEGEPVKSLAERSAPDSVWRDVAGMLRSFDYAAASVPGVDGQAWAERCRAAFLQGYAGGMSAADEALLGAYVADKAIYEVVYEIRNRPDWVEIPLRAVEALASVYPSSTADQRLSEQVKE
ncbi:MAG TPA: phosphotransferase [Propionibacteriaceae bacterium]|nr:phosphotransferase [Propionibacteriaceae bacterium]